MGARSVRCAACPATSGGRVTARGGAPAAARTPAPAIPILAHPGRCPRVRATFGGFFPVTGSTSGSGDAPPGVAPGVPGRVVGAPLPPSGSVSPRGSLGTAHGRGVHPGPGLHRHRGAVQLALDLRLGPQRQPLAADDEVLGVEDAQALHPGVGLDVLADQPGPLAHADPPAGPQLPDRPAPLAGLEDLVRHPDRPVAARARRGLRPPGHLEAASAQVALNLSGRSRFRQGTPDREGGGCDRRPRAGWAHDRPAAAAGASRGAEAGRGLLLVRAAAAAGRRIRRAPGATGRR